MLGRRGRAGEDLIRCQACQAGGDVPTRDLRHGATMTASTTRMVIREPRSFAAGRIQERPTMSVAGTCSSGTATSAGVRDP